MRVDLNADVGEGLDGDAALMEVVCSVNIACGGHAGDAATMRRTLALAAQHGIAVGAHPGYADREGFGRRDLALRPEAVFALVLEQLATLAALATEHGLRLRHVKPHGALYNRAGRDAATAEAIVAAARAHRSDLILVGLPASQVELAAARAGVLFAAEAFADRTYQDDGSLTPRTEPNAFVRDPVAAAERVVTMLAEGRVRSAAGRWISLRADTVCVHGDEPDAPAFASSLVRHLRKRGVVLRALGAP